METISVKLITPERVVFSGDATQITLPTSEGEVTVLPHHIPLVALLRPGEIRVEDGAGNVVPLAVSTGFISVEGQTLSVFVETAEHVEEILVERAKEAHDRAVAAMEEKHLDAAEYGFLAAKVEKELARMHIVRKYRGRIDGMSSSPESDS